MSFPPFNLVRLNVYNFLLEEEIQLEIDDTNKAVERFNELSKTGIKIAAALHLAC